MGPLIYRNTFLVEASLIHTLHYSAALYAPTGAAIYIAFIDYLVPQYSPLDV